MQALVKKRDTLAKHCGAVLERSAEAKLSNVFGSPTPNATHIRDRLGQLAIGALFSSGVVVDGSVSSSSVRTVRFLDDVCTFHL